MNDEFFKFPTTPHLAVLGDGDIRQDKVLSRTQQNQFLDHRLVVEEKLDGANLGISFDSEGVIRVQNRGAYLQPPYFGQWKKLPEWLATHQDGLFDCLTDRYILFGEWCYAQHSVKYDCLPDWFFGFDVYDRHMHRFFCCSRRDGVLDKIGLCGIPRVGEGHFTLYEICDLLGQSKYSTEPAEGLYLRADQEDWLIHRAKMARLSFIQSIEQHWSRSGIKPNRLESEQLTGNRVSL